MQAFPAIGYGQMKPVLRSDEGEVVRATLNFRNLKVSSSSEDAPPVPRSCGDSKKKRSGAYFPGSGYPQVAIWKVPALLRARMPHRAVTAGIGAWRAQL